MREAANNVASTAAAANGVGNAVADVHIAPANTNTTSTLLLQQQPQVLKWSTKEKLFLVSFVLINGESNWSYVSEQLNKWMLMTSTNEATSATRNNNTSSSSDDSKRTAQVGLSTIEYLFVLYLLLYYLY